MPSPPLRVVLVEFTPSGGLFQFAVQLGEALAERGHDVQVLTGPEPELTANTPGLRIRPVLPTWHPMDGYPMDGYPTDGRASPAGAVGPVRRRLRRLTRVVRYVAAYAVVRRVVRREQPDVVQWSNWWFPLDGPLVRWVGTASPAVMLDLAHSPRPLNEQQAGGQVFKPLGRLRGLHEQAYRRMDAVPVLGAASRRDLVETWPSVRRVEVLPHGDEGVFRTGRAVPPPSSCGPEVLFFGNLATYKGLDVLLAAFEVVRRALPTARLTVAGAPAGDVDLAALQRQAERTGGVRLRAGYVLLPEVAALFGAARVVVAPYRYANGTGVVALAQTFGRPVVASDVGDLPVAVQDGVSGLLVPVEDPAALATALLRVLADGDLADRLGSAGEAAITASGSWAVVAERLEAVYRDCLTGAATGAG